MKKVSCDWWQLGHRGVAQLPNCINLAVDNQYT